MKKGIIALVVGGLLSSCTTTGETNTAAAIKQVCDGAEIVVAIVQPWADAGQLSSKNTRTFNAANEALFAEGTGLCVAPPSGNLAVILARVSSFALSLALVRRDGKE